MIGASLTQKSLFIAVLLFGLLRGLHAAGAEELPFTVKVTNVTPASLPDYLDPFTHPSPTGQWSDFPVAPVMIDRELYIIYKNGYSDKVIRYKGSNIENAVRQPDGTLNPKHPIYGTVIHPYLLGGMWYDPAEQKLYAPMHCEYPGYTTGDGIVLRQTHLAVSADKGLTWTYEGPLITGDTAIPAFAYSGSHWDGGDGDFYLYVDEPGGYFYIFTTFYQWPKPGINAPFFMRHRVARCKISDKMASGKWQRFHHGDWIEPGIGGKSSYVDAHRVIYCADLKKYVGFNYGGGLSACTDLAKQDWSACFSIPGNYWGSQKNLEITPVDVDGINTWVCGRTIYLYTYLQGWNAGPGTKYQIEFGPGVTTDAAGYLGWGAGLDIKKFFSPGWEGSPTTDPLRPYGEPCYDSADSIEARRVRKVDCTSPETVCLGAWKLQDAPIASRNSDHVGDSVMLEFEGTGIYWRAQQGPDCGKADVFLDGTLQKTVDCCGAYTPYKFWFVKTGHDAGAHSIKIVVRGDKNANSTGTWIKHMSFECAGDCNQASDGFSGLIGKNGWHYLAWDGKTYSQLEFVPTANVWQEKGNKLTVGPDWLMPEQGRDAVRQWVVPHDGLIRVEGSLSTGPGKGDGIKAEIAHNAAIVWPSEIAPHAEPWGHDLRLRVKKGDTLSFRVSRRGTIATVERCEWDPLITFVEPQ
jgi:hypothetical protein